MATKPTLAICAAYALSILAFDVIATSCSTTKPPTGKEVLAYTSAARAVISGGISDYKQIAPLVNPPKTQPAHPSGVILPAE